MLLYKLPAWLFPNTAGGNTTFIKSLAKSALIALNCNSEGVLGSTTALVGSYMAAETIKYVCNTGNILTNKLLVFDCLNGVFEVFSVEKNVKCLVCNNKY